MSQSDSLSEDSRRTIEEIQFLEKEADSLRQQINDAKNKRFRTGESAPQDWWERTNKSLMYKHREIKEKYQNLNKIKAQERLQRAMSGSASAEMTALYKVAEAADLYLFGDEEDDTAGDILEDRLNSLSNINPNWRKLARI